MGQSNAERGAVVTAHPEMQLLSYIIENGALNEALNWGIKEDDFLTDEGHDVFTGMMYSMSDPRLRRSQLGTNAITNLYPEFVFCSDPTMTLEALCTQVRQQRHKLELQTCARELLTGRGDPLEVAIRALERLQRNVIAVGYGQRNDINFAEALERSLLAHDRQAAGIDLSVAKWPWEPFNAATGGVQNDDYIVFYGRPKSKKSWMLAYFAAHMFLQGKFPLIYTKEMTADNLFKRISACIARVQYQDYRGGRLSAADRQELQMILESVKDVREYQDMITLDGKDSRGGGDTVEWLHAKVDKYKPDVVLIDGMYLLSDNKGGKNQKDNFRVQNISRDIRQMILETEIPVVATIQATRAAAGHKNANLDEIAFSDAIAQDATAAMRVVNEDRMEEFGGKDVASLIVGGSREWRFSGCRIYAECATDFTFIANLDSREAENVKARDDRTHDKDVGAIPAVAKVKKDVGLRAKIGRDVKNMTANRLRGLQVPRGMQVR